MNLTHPAPDTTDYEYALFALECKRLLDLLGNNFITIGNVRIGLHVWADKWELTFSEHHITQRKDRVIYFLRYQGDSKRWEYAGYLSHYAITEKESTRFVGGE